MTVPTVDALDAASVDVRDVENAFARTVASEPFDLRSGPLVRAAVLRFSPAYHALVLVLHHIVSDRWSLGIFLDELATLYGGSGDGRSDDLAPLVFRYEEYAQREGDDNAASERDIAYWKTTLQLERATLALPTDRPRPAQPSHRGGVVALSLDADRVARIVRAGAALRATPFMTFLAGFLALLQRYTGQTDLIVGTPVAGREHLERETPIGLFVNTLPLRVQTTPDDTCAALIAKVRAATLGLLTHQAIPFDRLVRETLGERDPSRNPFFDVVFNFHNTPTPAAWPREFFVETDDVDLGTSRLDLSVLVRPERGGTMTCRFEFARDLFDVATIEAMASQYGVLLDALARDPQSIVDRLPLCEPSERATILDVWSVAAPPADFVPDTEHSGTLHSLVERARFRTPDAIALIEEGNASITFRELDGRANRLAHALRACGVGRDIVVGLYLQRSIDTVVTMLATLKAGGAYLPLDPAYPEERTAFMLSNAGARTIVACRRSFEGLVRYGLPLLDVDEARRTSRYPNTASPSDVAPGDLAYVMYTSGTTGMPKAVAIAHRGVVALLTATPALEFEAGDVFLLHAALTFDASTLLWAPLAAGARVAVMPPGPFSLAEFGAKLAAFQITILEATPALFHQLVEERLDDLRGLRRCLVGGDVFSPAIGARFVNEVPGCRLFNGYGPTEATVIATSHEIRADSPVRNSVPIGRPIAHARAYILDRQLEPVAAGVPGELYLGGDGLARGYLNDDALTERQFQPDPFRRASDARIYRTGDRARWLPTGDIELLGRVDAQIKVRGFRIEPAEIEFALLEHPAVRHAAVCVRNGVAGPYIACYAELRNADADEVRLSDFLKTKVPAHAVPSRIVVMDALPKTSSGKLDRKRLPEPPERTLPATDDDVPQSDIERRIATIAQELLGLERLGRNDDFFSLGGHSLLATRMIARMADAFDVDVSLRDFFGAPTLAGIARLVREAPPQIRTSVRADDDIAARLATLSDAEIDALLAATLPKTTATARFRCALLGESTLVVRCAELLRARGHAVVAVIEPPLDARAALARVVESGEIDYVFSVISITYLDAEVLATVTRGAINLHDGPLPRYAGRYATTWAIAAREREHGVTWHEMNGRIDGGRILKARSVPIDGDTAFSLNVKCYEAAFAAFEELVGELETGTVSAREQNLAQRTYFAGSKRPSPACLIDWSRPANELDAFARALNFERTPNPLGRPAFFAGPDAYACCAIERTGDRTTLQPGSIARHDGAAIVVATRDELVRVRGIERMAGGDVASTEPAADALSPGRVLRSLAALPFADIEAVAASAVRHEAQWVSRLEMLQPLALAEFAEAASDAPRDATFVETGGASAFRIFAAFCTSLADISGLPEFDVSFLSADEPPKPPEVAALFAASLPLRVAGAAGIPLAEAAARIGREAAAQRGTFAWDVFARYPHLHARRRHFRHGTLPVAVVFVDPEHSLVAIPEAEVTLVVASGAARLEYRRNVRASLTARRVARDMSAALGDA